MATTRKRPKLLGAGLKKAGITDKGTRKEIKSKIRAGRPAGLKALGVKRPARRIARENIAASAATRASRRANDRARAASRTASRTERRVRRVLPQGIRGSRRTGGGR